MSARAKAFHAREARRQTPLPSIELHIHVAFLAFADACIIGGLHFARGEEITIKSKQKVVDTPVAVICHIRYVS